MIEIPINHSKKSNLRNNPSNQINNNVQAKKVGITPASNLLTGENSFYQQTKESNVTTFTKNSFIYNKNNNLEPMSKANNDFSVNSKQNTNNVSARAVSKSPIKQNNLQVEKKISLHNNNSNIKKEPKRSSQPITTQRSSINKTKDEGIDIIPFSEESNSKFNFKTKGALKTNQDEDLVNGLINDGYVE